MLFFLEKAGELHIIILRREHNNVTELKLQMLMRECKRGHSLGK